MDGFDSMFGQSAGRPANGVAANDDPAGSRGRDSLFLVAQMQLGDGISALEVRIRNLSAGGMMVEHPGDVAIGTVAVLELRGIGRVTGRVAWWTQGRMGIALDRPIDPKRARKPVVGGTKTPFYAKSVAETTPKRR